MILANVATENRNGNESSVDFSIILINYNSAHYIDHCLNHISTNNFEGSVEIIVINNLATDNSLEILKNHPDITIVNPGINLGYSGGNNLGISKSHGKYILCLNFDCFLTDDFLKKIYDSFESNLRLGMISGKLRKLVKMQPTMYLDSTGIDFVALVPADRGEWQYDVGQYDAMTNIFGPSGAAACYRRKALESVVYRENQYFDEQMFTYCEDIDLSWRLNLAGWRGLYVPDALAYHERGATRKKSSIKKIGYQLIGISNRYFTILKNFRRKDGKDRVKKLIRQELRMQLAFCGINPLLWMTLIYVLLRLAVLVLRPSFINKRSLAHRHHYGNHLDLSMDTDFWKALYEERTQRPLSSDCWSVRGSEGGVFVTKDCWQATCRWFWSTKWEDNGFFFSAICLKRKSYIEIRIPEEYQGNLKNMRLYIDMEAKVDLTFKIQVFSIDGRESLSDWHIFSGGKGLFSFYLDKMNLSPGINNIQVWQEPWATMRLILYTRLGKRINIRNIFFDEDIKRFPAID
jgi:GT2 family glycosyltransferase